MGASFLSRKEPSCCKTKRAKGIKILLVVDGHGLLIGFGVARADHHEES